MQSLGLRRYTLTIGAAAALLAGCNGSQPPIGTPGAMQQSRVVATHADRGRSWMDHAASGEDLLYVAVKPGDGAVYVYTYPKGHLVGTLTGFYEAFGECTDTSGDVFVVTLADASSTSSTIYEYVHGGSAPIAALSDPNVANGCAVDPLTGDLAASGEDVAIFQHASGTPKIYSSSQFGFAYCGYDDNGNLYISASGGKNGGFQLVRLAKGSSQFEQIRLKPTLYTGNVRPSVQWDGKHVSVSSDAYREPITIYRLRISGTRATVINSATLSSKKNFYHGQLWIQGKTIIGVGAAKSGKENAFLWAYPSGGMPRGSVKAVGKVGHPEASGVTVSLAGSR